MTRAPHADLLRYLEGGMTAAEVRMLEERLRHEADLRKELLILSGFDAVLPGALQDVARESGETAQASVIPPSGAHWPRAKVRRWVWPMATAAALLIAVGGYLHHKTKAAEVGLREVAKTGVNKQPELPPAVRVEPAEGRLVALVGDVRVARADGSGSAVVATVGFEVHAGEVVMTASNASAHFAYADGSTLHLHRASVLALSRGEEGSCLDLQAGAVDAMIRNKLDGKRLHIIGDLLHADANGTDFRLVADGRSRWLGVRDGEVVAARVVDGQKVVLQAGNYAAVAPDWPFMRMDARVCPAWKGVCQQATGTPYP